MDSGVAPRVNASMLKAHVGSMVCIAGRQTQPAAGGGGGGSSSSSSSSGTLELEASDKHRVHVRGVTEDLSHSLFLEIIGKVEADGSLLYIDHGCLGAQFDLDNYDAMVQLSHNSAYKSLHF